MLNNCSFIGRITKDLELKQTNQKGTYYVRFTIAVQRDWNRAEADFIDCIAWTKSAEAICKFFHKGDRICIVGALTTKTMEDQTGAKRKYSEIMIKSFDFIEKKQEQTQPTGEILTPPPMPEAITEQADEESTNLPFDLGATFDF